MHVVHGDTRAGRQRRDHGAIVAVRGLRRDEAFVTPPDVQLRRVDLSELKRDSDALRRRRSCTPARENEVGDTALLNSGGDPSHGILRHGLHDGIHVVRDNVGRLGLAHRETVRVTGQRECRGEDIAVHVIGVETAKLFAQEVVHGALRHRHELVVIVSGKAHRDALLTRPHKADVAVLAVKGHGAQAVIGFDDLKFDRNIFAERALEPGLHEQRRRIVFEPFDSDGLRLVGGRGVVRGCDETAPVGDARPRQIGIARLVTAGETQKGRLRAFALVDVGDAALRDCTERILRR